MLQRESPLTQLRHTLATGAATPVSVAAECIARANGNASRNTYLHLAPEALLAQARDADPSAPLYGVPISLKDCFDLAGTVTTAGSRFYAGHNKPAEADSAIAHALKAAGALIPGKTHLHALAYGITGQNPQYGDCLQPRDATLLTGGSSSGAAASVQEGSALAAIGTDTGGSIRVPAALCGIAGYRASHWTPDGALQPFWRGGHHLAPTFDTIGFLARDPRDLAPIANSLFGVPIVAAPVKPRIAFAAESWLTGATPEVLEGYAAWRAALMPLAADLAPLHPDFWRESWDIFSPIQACEAAQIHAAHAVQFEPSIAERLRWGASIGPAEIAALHERLRGFRAQMDALFAHADFILLPASPVHRLMADQDQLQARANILKYTTPFSLAGVPVVSLPGEIVGAPLGTGVQIASAPGQDAALLAFVATVGQSLVQSPALA
jgi:Asp-tRNA(Asn)/Glu-tRNA(Gln) amidotransferase A subunit family amidase